MKKQQQQQHFIYNCVLSIWRPKIGRLLGSHTGISSNFANSYSTNVGTSSCTNSTHWYNHIQLASSKFAPFSKAWCKEKKIEILKLRPLAVFEDMLKMKNSSYSATTHRGPKLLTLNYLQKKAGVYMITNKVTKKYYIGMSKDLKSRVSNYLCIKRLNDNKSSRIHKALLKHGFSNFSFTILELSDNNKTSVLREREDFFINIFKPQYNIVRSHFNLDSTWNNKFSNSQLSLAIPLKIKNLLSNALDPTNLDCHLVWFQFSKTKNYYTFVWTTPKYAILAKSSGWFEGDITKDEGYKQIPQKKGYKRNTTLLLEQYRELDKKTLAANFFPKEKDGFVQEQFKKKANALKKEEARALKKKK